MSGFMRKMKRGIMRDGNRRRMAGGGAPAAGTVRAGMHQAAEHAYRRAMMTEGEARRTEIEEPEPGIGEQDPGIEEVTAEIAEGTVTVEADEELEKEIADPGSAFNEENPEAGARMSADWSAERIPVLDPVTGGIGEDEDIDLIYVSGDAVVKPIGYPGPEAETRKGVPPFFPEADDPSANVPAEPEAEAPEAEG